ncbi:MAG TPA: tetratricopeptide repeat protein [Gemmatimonadales bacterium]|nr:tetratricopeptide repeat protein [Gemmatimonadales bacterium]
MATTEIEKLERRYAENPQGLTFAPLAEVHRKNGDIPRALELLKSGLELHPNYIPASIVLGRCHWDQGDLPAAEAAFSHVLRLDDENVIALKSLAELSERLGRTAEAQRWLKRLISIDRSNEDAREHLARLEGSKAEAPASSVSPSEPPAPVAPAPAQSPTAAVEKPGQEVKVEEPGPRDLTVSNAEPAGQAVSNEPVEVPAASPPLQFLDTSQSPPRAEPVSQAPEPKTVRKEETAEPAQVEGLISQEFVPPKEGGYHLHPELAQEFGTVEAPERLEVETAGEVELQSSGSAEFRVPNAAEEFMEAAPAPELTELTLKPPPPTPSPSVAAAPPPPLRAPTAPSPSGAPARPPVPAGRSYSVRETRGQSVTAFFQALLSARPPGGATATPSPDAQQDGRAPTPAGSETARPTADPAGQTAPPSAAVPAAAASADPVSFDDFFGAAAGGSGPTKNPGEAGKDDLDQFQSWLQNLKR